MRFQSLSTFYIGLTLIVRRHGTLERQRGRSSWAASTVRATRDATPASPSTTWASTSARSSRRSCAVISASASTGTSGFAAAGVGMVCGVIQYVMGGKYLGDAGLYPTPASSPEAAATLKTRATVVGVVTLIAVVAVMRGMYTGMLPVSAKQVADGRRLRPRRHRHRVFCVAVLRRRLDAEPSAGGCTRSARCLSRR